MEWKIVVLILGCFIAYFGMFWTMSLTNVSWDININMDNNTLEAVKLWNQSINTVAKTKYQWEKPRELIPVTHTGDNTSLVSLRSSYNAASEVYQYIDDENKTHMESFIRMDGIWYKDGELIE